ncbi:MAG TPA: hypothetical protein VHN37_03245 [Actinomycetota bacterium]|nr:hypothetical protein [Actinomycetota bacterium]
MRKKLCASAVGVALLCTPLVHSSAAAQGTAATGFVRGVYGRDASPSGVATLKQTGFNTVTVQPWRDHLDALQRDGLRGLVWLFGYNNDTCSFDRGEAWVRETVAAIAGHPAIVAYNVADEPNYNRCPDSPGEIAERARLVKELDPSKPTYVVVAAWDGREGFPYQHFAGKTDIMGLDIYPCSYYWESCKFSDIDVAADEAVKDGVRRYWAIIQDFSDNWYRVPTATELERQFDKWAGSGMEGYFVYHWNEGQVETRPDHMAVLQRQNARTFGTAPAPSPSPTPTPTPTPTPSPTPSATPTPSPTPSATPSPTPTPTPSATPSPSPSATPAPTSTPSPSNTPDPTATPTATPDETPPLVVSPAPLPAPRPAAPRPPFSPGGKHADKRPPSPPRDLLSAAVDEGSRLWWKPARDDRRVVGYAVWRDGRRIGRTASTEFTDPVVQGEHVYAVRAFDAAGNRSKPAVVKVTTLRRATAVSGWFCLRPVKLFRTC